MSYWEIHAISLPPALVTLSLSTWPGRVVAAAFLPCEAVISLVVTERSVQHG